MKLIIDSGATKAEWCFLNAGEPVKRFRTAGMNFSTMSADAVESIIGGAVSQSGDVTVSEVHLYAAGLIEGSAASVSAKQVFERTFSGAEVTCASDMLAAARAVCGRSEGIAAIVGTGSNSCLYDGVRILRNVRSGGFILGDEGGGACLGKLFLADHVKGLVPEPLASEFGAAFQVDYLTVVDNVYRRNSPSAYLGSFAPWILDHCGSSAYVESMVRRTLTDFFERSLMQYDRPDVPVGFVGGFASACSAMIMRIAEEKGLRVSKVLEAPMDGLVEYHSL